MGHGFQPTKYSISAPLTRRAGYYQKPPSLTARLQILFNSITNGTNLEAVNHIIWGRGNTPCGEWENNITPELFLTILACANPTKFRKLLMNGANKSLPSMLNNLGDDFLEGVKIAEIGGEFASFLRKWGAETYQADRKFGYQQNETIMLANYREFFPERIDLVFGNCFFERKSGINATHLGVETDELLFPTFSGTKKYFSLLHHQQLPDDPSDSAAIEIMAVCANITKVGGYIVFNNHDSQLLEIPENILRFFGIIKVANLDLPGVKTSRFAKNQIHAYRKIIPATTNGEICFSYRRPKIHYKSANQHTTACGIYLLATKGIVRYSSNGQKLELYEVTLPLEAKGTQEGPGKSTYHTL